MFKQVTICLCLILASGVLSSAADRKPPLTDEAAPLFDTKRIQVLHLTVSATDWATIEQADPQGPPRSGKPDDVATGLNRDGRAEPVPPEAAASFAYVHADLEYQGTTWKSIGLRLKGNSSYRSSVGSLKRPFKLAFNRFVKGQKFLGLSGLHLNINAMDPSALREHLAYAIFQQDGIPCSRTAYARVYLTVFGKYDHQYLGLYTLIEDVDATFAKSRFGEAKGLLVKPRRAEDLPYCGDQWQQYSRCYETKTEGNAALQKRLVEFIKLVHQPDDATFRNSVASYLDVDEFLRFIAINAWLSNMDSFLCTGQNFCLYVHPQTLRIVWIPWDLNETFAGFMPAGSPDEQINLSIDHPLTGANRLIDRILAIPEYGKAYHEHLARLMDTVFKPESLQAAVASTQRLIAEAQAEEAKAGVARTQDGGGPVDGASNRPRPQRPALGFFIERRIVSVADQLAGRSKGQVLRGHGPPGGPGGPSGGFHLIPRFAIEQMRLSEEQLRRIADLDQEVKGRLEKIVTPEQMKMLEEPRPPRPGGPDGQGGRPGR